MNVSSKWIDRLFGASLALLGLSALIMGVTGLAGIALPDWAVRLLGVCSLVSLPVLVWSTVKSWQEKAEMRKAGAKAGRSGAKKKKGKKK